MFPPENLNLWKELLAYPGAVFVSEFGFGKHASSLKFRMRNKLIAAFAQCVLVTQSAADEGALNVYRFGQEQRKPVATFKSDGTRDTLGNSMIGCDVRTGSIEFELAGNDWLQCNAWRGELSSRI